MNKLHCKKGDTVFILSGKDKGKRGKVLQVFPKEGKVMIEGVNIVKRHTRPTRDMRQGGIIQRPASIPVCKTMVVCPRCNKPARIRRGVEENKRVRRCRRCGETIDVR